MERATIYHYLRQIMMHLRNYLKVPTQINFAVWSVTWRDSGRNILSLISPPGPCLVSPSKQTTMLKSSKWDARLQELWQQYRDKEIKTGALLAECAKLFGSVIDTVAPPQPAGQVTRL
ncbi:uncharacterized protein LOC127873329 [Dreissena polymorpha]|uniref:uncharacterized protein LOC127873329 n=1 Tax=Dreissena polymorpha TaxID=45954 RepID=UPI002263B419|nr:uncharacterized protein LOC127873329 [Dreissena polymorpha]XP_052273138.1 uncharacterized protein LOC127873329 [Dreissena polymorpha]